MRKSVRSAVTSILGTALLFTGIATLSPATAAAAPAPEEKICDPLGCDLGHVVLRTEVDSSGTRYRRLYVCDNFDDGLSVTARVDFGTEVRPFADPNPFDNTCQKHSFYVSIRKFRLTIGSWASAWYPPPAL